MNRLSCKLLVIVGAATLSAVRRFKRGNKHMKFRSPRISVARLVLAAAYFTTPVFAGSATWDLVPASNDWNSATNWTPSTVPNGPADTATFAFSFTTAVSLSADTEVNGIVFNAIFVPYSITVGNNFLAISGAGITNNSVVQETFVTTADGPFVGGEVHFFNSATAGSSTVFINNASTVAGGVGAATGFSQNSSAGTATITNNGGSVSVANTNGGFTFFLNSATASASIITNNGAGNAAAPNAFGYTSFSDMSTAGAATITNNGGTDINAMGGETRFTRSATAGTATITNKGAEASQVYGGVTRFFGGATAGAATINNTGGTVLAANGANTVFNDNATAGTATITNSGGGEMGARGGYTLFFGGASADAATIINNGETVSGGEAGYTQFRGDTSAGNATIINHGGAVSFGRGGFTLFTINATAANATLIADEGSGMTKFPPLGGSIEFAGLSTGGTSRVEVFGSGQIDISQHASPGVTIGSLEGSGNAFLGANNLSVGSNDRSTNFSGVMRDGGIRGSVGGSLTKIGAGTLTLSGTNTYTGATTVNSGKLLVDGSIASSLGVTVNAGATLGGHGAVSSIAGGGAVAPGNSAGILTATQVVPSGGTSFVFELNQVGSPTYSNAAASGNDLLHLTGPTPFTSALTSANVITIDFSGASLSAGEIFRGGFFTDVAVATADVSNATFDYIGLNGFTVNFDGFVTEAMAAFASGTVLNGTVLEFDISGTGSSVPDSGASWLLLSISVSAIIGLEALTRRRLANG